MGSVCNHNIRWCIRWRQVVLVLGLMVFTGCEIRPLDPVTGKAIIEETQQAFDAASFVDENWSTQVLPAIQQNAVDLSQLLAELEADPAAASEAYGLRQGSNPYNFIVSGRGVVTRVDTTSRAGVVEVDVSGHTAAVNLQIGPVIRGTALRDGLPFISFDQFVNQLEYARVSQALHDQLVTSVLADVDLAELNGKEIAFNGVFTLRDPASLLITPIEIQLVTEVAPGQ